MTDEEDIIDDKNQEDFDEQEDENDDIETLNEAYDRVSGSGELPSVDDFFSDQDSGDPYGGISDSDGIGGEVGDFRISDEPVEMPEDDEEGDSIGEDTGDLQPDKFNFKQILDGSFFTKEAFSRIFPFILFIVMLSILYIGNRNIAESLIKRNIVLQREVRELRAESITIAAQLMDISKETEVSNRVEQKKLGIHEQKVPPRIFFVEKFESEEEDTASAATKKRRKRSYTNDFNDFEDDYKKIR